MTITRALNEKFERPQSHPGEILRDEFMEPLGLSSNALALDLHVPPNRISEIVAERRAVTPDTALRLSIYFGTTAQFWLNLQYNHEMSLIRADEVRKQVRPRQG